MSASANLDFFAAEADQRAVLDFLFSATDVRVFESYSEFDADLREFRSTDELAATFPLGTDRHGNGHAVLLQLWSPSVMSELSIERFALKPEACDGHHSATALRAVDLCNCIWAAYAAGWLQCPTSATRAKSGRRSGTWRKGSTGRH